jgi:hypothetical protein
VAKPEKIPAGGGLLTLSSRLSLSLMQADYADLWICYLMDCATSVLQLRFQSARAALQIKMHIYISRR